VVDVTRLQGLCDVIINPITLATGLSDEITIAASMLKKELSIGHFCFEFLSLQFSPFADPLPPEPNRLFPEVA
jgi:hypothetical protein